MPTCNQCSGHFPNRLIQEGKIFDLRGRKYCFSCSPFGTRSKCGPKPKFCTEERICDECGRKHKAKKNLVCSSCRTARQRENKKNKALEYKGWKCKECGYNKCSNALVFHHREPEEKLFNLSVVWTWEWERIKPEVDKCDLLCANCHSELHEKIDMEARENRIKSNWATGETGSTQRT